MVTLTPLAKEYLQSVANGGFVSLGVKSGGCNGFEYIWALEAEDTRKQPCIEPVEGFLLIDPMAELYLFGSQVDYITDLAGSFLKVSNPSATSSCGCGESFGV
jgi:iron-sulfur cluster assembly accessory protein|tara:strand:- start:293 stop:601 length:309 start_codon:yes stop_codon:yes gene_type:complete